MKKCLLTILAGALLIVSCQNYDDQFDDLNSQIIALASQVAGLGKVQSDLTALAGTVNSLESSIAASVDQQLTSGLAGINETVATLEAAIDGIASSEEVQAIQSDVDAAQTDLTELLNNSNVYQGDLTISTPSQLSAALAFGTKVNIVNGNVAITHETTMDADSIQLVVNRINTVVKDFSYLSQSSAIKEVTFNTVTGVASLTAKGVGYQFANLESATNVFLHDEYKSKVSNILFDKLTTVTTLNTRNGATDTGGTIAFNKGTALHLTALKRYPGASLVLRVDEGGVIKIDALDNVDALGKKTALSLTIEGPSSVNYTTFTKGTITLKNVATATVDNNTTGFVIDEGVVSFTSNSVVALNVTAAADLETLDITGVKNSAATPVAPAISFASATDLTNLTLKGAIASVTATGNGNLTNVTISAAVTGAVNLSTNTDLTGVTLTGSSMTGFTFGGNTDMENLTVDTTWSGTTLDGSLSVTGNTSLISLTCSSDNLETLTVTGNDDLITLNFAGVAKVGATGKPTVSIYGNDLTASAVDTVEDPAVSDFGSTDGGSFTSASGMDTLKTYLTAVSALTATANVHVFWDTMESFTDEASAEATDKLYISTDTVDAQTNAIYITVLRLIPNSAAAGSGAAKAKTAWLLSGVSTGHLLGLVNNGTDIFKDDASLTYALNEGVSSIALDGAPAIDLAKIISASHVTRATATEATLAAALGGGMANTITISSLSDTSGASGTVTGERYTTSVSRIAATSGASAGEYAIFMNADDYVTLTVGGNTATATGNATGALAVAVAAAWQAKYGFAGTASASSNGTVTGGDNGVITVTGLVHSGGNSLSLGMALTSSGTVGTGDYAEGPEWVIGTTRSVADNTLISSNIIITLESNVAGSLLNKLVAVGMTGSSTILQLTTSVLSNSVGASELLGHEAAHMDAADARLPEDTVAGGASTAVTKTRVAWL